MKNGVFGKGLAVAIIILFVGASVVPSIGTAVTKGNTRITVTNGEKKIVMNTIQVISHLITPAEIAAMKQQLGVYDRSKNYNVLFNGHGTGLIQPTEEQYEQMGSYLRVVDNIIPSAPLPSSYDLSTDPSFPIIGNQGLQGSCAAWAATYYCNGYIQAKQNNWNQAYLGNTDQLLSPAWTYNKCNRGVDQGSMADWNMYVMQSVGVCRWSQMPYDDSDYISWGTENAWRDAPPYRINNIYSISKEDITGIKNLINSGYPVTFALDASSYDYFGTDDVLGSTAMQYDINHVNTIVGYDDSKTDVQTGEVGAFKIANSWGTTGWQDPDDDGYYWMTYQAFSGGWNTVQNNWCDDLYITDYPKLLATWRFNPQGDRSASIQLGIGPYGNPLDTKVPWWDGSSEEMHSYPAFMCVDINEFYNEWVTGASSFYLAVGDAVNDGTITSFKVEAYDTSYVPGSPSRVSPESPDTPKNTPCYVTCILNNDLLDQSQDILEAGYALASTQWLAQSFKPSLGTLTRIELLISREYTTSYSVKISIRDNLLGNDIVSVTKQPEDFPILTFPFNEWTEIDFPDAYVVPEETYYIVCTTNQPIGDYNWFGNGNNLYERGQAYFSYDQGSSWVIRPTIDLCFKTYGIENQPPNKPVKPSGTASGKINVEYTYTTSTTDPDGDQVSYWFDWGDGTNSGWVGPLVSGATASAKHTWTAQGTYPIKVKAKDTNNAESDWSDPLSVVMPRSRTINTPFLLKLLERFPHAFPILRHLMGL